VPTSKHRRQKLPQWLPLALLRSSWWEQKLDSSSKKSPKHHKRP